MDSQRFVEKLVQNLQCPVCFELPTKPIFTCIVGHLVCATCHERLSVCPICRGEFHGTRNFVAEELVTTIKQFIQSSSGNPSSPNGRTKSAVGNPVRCCLAVDGCRNKIMDSSYYIEHLKNIHWVPAFRRGKGKFSGEVLLERSSNTFVKRRVEPLLILEVAGKSFVINMFQDGDRIQIWAETEIVPAEPVFLVRLSIPIITGDGTGLDKISWTGNINGFHVTEKSVLISQTCLKVSACQLRKYLQMEPYAILYWKIDVHIYKSGSKMLLGRCVPIGQNVREALSAANNTAQPFCVGLTVQPTLVLKGLSVFFFVLAIYVTYCVTYKKF